MPTHVIHINGNEIQFIPRDDYGWEYDVHPVKVIIGEQDLGIEIKQGDISAFAAAFKKLIDKYIV